MAKSYVPAGYKRKSRTIQEKWDEKIRDLMYWGRIDVEYEAFDKIFDDYFSRHKVKARPKTKKP